MKTAPLFIPTEHLTPYFQGAVDAAAKIRKYRNVDLGVVGMATAGIGLASAVALGVITGTGPQIGAIGAGAFAVFDTLKLRDLHKSNGWLKKHKANVRDDLGKELLVRKEHIKLYGLPGEPSAAWKKLSKDYGLFLIQKKGITFIPKGRTTGLLGWLRGGTTLQPAFKA